MLTSNQAKLTRDSTSIDDYTAQCLTGSSSFILLEDEVQQHGHMERASTPARKLECKQKWNLLVSSSACVTEMTCIVIAVCYSELVTVSPRLYLSFPPDEDLLDSFLSIFLNVLRASLHAVVDIDAVVDWLQFQFSCSRDANCRFEEIINCAGMTTHRGGLLPFSNLFD